MNAHSFPPNSPAPTADITWTRIQELLKLLCDDVELDPENPTEAQSEMLNGLYTLSVLLDPSTRHFYEHQINQITLAAEKFEEGFLEHAKLLPDDSLLLRRSLAFLHD